MFIFVIEENAKELLNGVMRPKKGWFWQSAIDEVHKVRTAENPFITEMR